MVPLNEKTVEELIKTIKNDSEEKGRRGCCYGSPARVAALL